jgi:diadenylate cyclase
LHSNLVDLLSQKGIIEIRMINWLSYLAFAIDISFIALLIYSVLIFFKRTRSYTVFIGLVIAVGLYGLAKFLDLQLTLLALKYFVSISFVVFVVVFQTELRKYFELLGLIGERQISANKFATKSPEMNEVYRACVEMADTKFGALVVIKGRDDIDYLIEGGTQLDGIISEETILSIFFPNSAGHDGALIISNNRIDKFGAHLPLSVNFKEIGKHGTRHAAALGMSESTDALCIVVSEEKGTISICRDGKLKTLDDPQHLEKEIDKFTRAKFEATSGGVFTHIFKHNAWMKLAALLLALAFWVINR